MLYPFSQGAINNQKRVFYIIRISSYYYYYYNFGILCYIIILYYILYFVVSYYINIINFLLTSKQEFKQKGKRLQKQGF